MLIQEVILENFMSYEYARVPFKPGVNVIGGPNGAGKSSLLLAISVGLGQSYTERSSKLSDLIRWGNDQARVTIILDNSKVGNKRPVQNTIKTRFSSPASCEETASTGLNLKTMLPQNRMLNVYWAGSALTQTTC